MDSAVEHLRAQQLYCSSCSGVLSGPIFGTTAFSSVDAKKTSWPLGPMQSAPANMERVTPPSSKKGRRSYVLQRDFRVLEREQRVTKILNSGAFRSELEGIMKGQIDGSRRPPKLSKAIQRLQENVVEATASRHGQGTASLQVTVPAQPVLPIDDLRGVNASKYTLAERHLRCKLAAVYRLVDMFGWSQLIHNHITVSIRP